MSADNYIAVYPSSDKWIVCHGFMSSEIEDCQYRGSERSIHESRELALVAAHDLHKEESVVEYGVIELEAIQEPCERCYVCIFERKIVAKDLPKCAKCGSIFTSSDWVVMTQEGDFHTMCEPR